MSEQEAKLYEIMGKMLKEARLKAGFTLEQAGEKIGVIAKTIQRYETGQRTVSYTHLYIARRPRWVYLTCGICHKSHLLYFHKAYGKTLPLP